MNNDIFLKDGTLSPYGFACGYIMRVELPGKDGVCKEIYREHNVYHVRSTYNNSPKLHSDFIGPVSHKFTIWETFETLAPARKLYNRIK